MPMRTRLPSIAVTVTTTPCPITIFSPIRLLKTNMIDLRESCPP
jgi:hypothetical protein